MERLAAFLRHAGGGNDAHLCRGADDAAVDSFDGLAADDVAGRVPESGVARDHRTQRSRLRSLELAATEIPIGG